MDIRYSRFALPVDHGLSDAVPLRAQTCARSVHLALALHGHMPAAGAKAADLRIEQGWSSSKPLQMTPGAVTPAPVLWPHGTHTQSDGKHCTSAGKYEVLIRLLA